MEIIKNLDKMIRVDARASIPSFVNFLFHGCRIPTLANVRFLHSTINTFAKCDYLEKHTFIPCNLSTFHIIFFRTQRIPPSFVNVLQE